MGSLILCLYSQQGGNELVIVQSQVWDFQEKSISAYMYDRPFNI